MDQEKIGSFLKQLRKEQNISQEQLAEKIYVSRQAITKWESGNGIPDIENLIAISSLFNESLDSLLSEEKSLISKHDFLYESRTEYDLDSPKKIDLKIGTAHELIIEKTKVFDNLLRGEDLCIGAVPYYKHIIKKELSE